MVQRPAGAPAMPPQDLSPGLYDHPLSAAVHQALASQPDSLHQLQPLDPAEAPQRLARYLQQLSETALASLPEAQRQQQQLALVNQIVALLQQQVPNAISAGDQLHPSVRLLQELRAAPLLPNEAPLARPLIPLADGTLLIMPPVSPASVWPWKRNAHLPIGSTCSALSSSGAACACCRSRWRLTSQPAGRCGCLPPCTWVPPTARRSTGW